MSVITITGMEVIVMYLNDVSGVCPRVVQFCGDGNQLFPCTRNGSSNDRIGTREIGNLGKFLGHQTNFSIISSCEQKIFSVLSSAVPRYTI